MEILLIFFIKNDNQVDNNNIDIENNWNDKVEDDNNGDLDIDYLNELILKKTKARYHKF